MKTERNRAIDDRLCDGLEPLRVEDDERRSLLFEVSADAEDYPSAFFLLRRIGDEDWLAVKIIGVVMVPRLAGFEIELNECRARPAAFIARHRGTEGEKMSGTLAPRTVEARKFEPLAEKTLELHWVGIPA